MGGSNKKHKRGSIPSSSVSALSVSASASASSISTELIERTPENDYGVLSDPEENTPTTPVPLLTKEDRDDPTTLHSHLMARSFPIVMEVGVDEEKEETKTAPADGSSHTPSEVSEQSQSSQSQEQTQQQEQPSSQPQSPSSQQPSPSLQAQKLQTQSPSKSLETLQLKLSRDKNFSRKITLHTFFSYVILAIEMQRACSASIARISPHDVEHLIIYMIEHHSATEDVKSYLRTLLETKVIHNLIEAIIEFNKDQTDALDKLFTTEEIELQEMNTRDTNTNANANANAKPKAEDIQVTIASSNTVTDQAGMSQTSHHRTGFFKRMRNFFAGCCGCK